MLKHSSSRAPCDTKCQTAGYKHHSLFPFLSVSSRVPQLLPEVKVLSFKGICSAHGLPCQKPAPQTVIPMPVPFRNGIKLEHVGNTMGFVYVINGASPTCSDVLSDRNNFPFYTVMHSENADAFWKLVVQHTKSASHWLSGRCGKPRPEAIICQRKLCFVILSHLSHSALRLTHRRRLITQWSSCWSSELAGFIFKHYILVNSWLKLSK